MPCKYHANAMSWECLCSGVAAIVVGLIHFLTCLSANHAHIKDGIKLREYEEAKYAIDPSMYASYG